MDNCETSVKTIAEIVELPLLSPGRMFYNDDFDGSLESAKNFSQLENNQSMRFSNKFGKPMTLALALTLLSFTASFAYPAPEYKFKVYNNTKVAIKRIQVSEDGKKWGEFDIAPGIRAGATVELVWDKSTDNGACEWWFKATWSDGEVSDAAKFDFCEKDLVIEFTK